MIFGKNRKGKKTALAAVSPQQIRKMPVEHLGMMLKSSLIKAEDGGADEMFVYVSIDRDD